MQSGEGQLVETYLDSGGRITCPPELVPAPGQYLLAQDGASDSPLAVPVFFSESAPNGFRAAPPPVGQIGNLTYWTPGTRLHLRGPLGHRFSLPSSARRVALIAFDDSPARLRGLIPLALKQDAALTLVCDHAPGDLSEEVEVQPLDSLSEVYQWADYAAIDIARENLSQLREMLSGAGQPKARAQVLIRTPMPCGALAECGVCAVTTKNSWVMVCKDGPVLDVADIK